MKIRELSRRSTAQAWRDKNPGTVKAMKVKDWAKHGVEQSARNQVKKKLKRWQARAHMAVHNAIKRGVMSRPGSCEDCEQKCQPLAHHDNYAKPFEVRWLCGCCHKDWHLKNGPGLSVGLV